MHGLQVFDLLTAFCPDSSFFVYQVVDDDQNVFKVPIVDAIEQAIADDVDVLNISVGKHQRRCLQWCALCRSLNQAIREGVVPVAAAGHQEDGGETVYCPAQVDEAVTVGGFVAECHADERPYPTPGIPGPELRPPYAYWIKKRSDAKYPDKCPDENFCSYNRCSPDKSCEEYREERLWEYNVQPANDKPDILGPVHYPHLRRNGPPYLAVGTSFSAPIVCGALAAIFGELFTKGVSTPPAFRVKQTVKTGGTPIGNTGFNKFNSRQTWEILKP